MSIPSTPVDLPPLVARIAAGRPATCVWADEIGGTTWRIDDPAGDEYVKLGPPHDELVPANESARHDWARHWLPTPVTLGHGEQDGLRWLHTAALPGRCAVDPIFTTNPALVPVAVAALGRALRTLHDTLPVAQCPWRWDVIDRLAALPSEVRERLGPAPEAGDDLIVCHGDACNPNFQLAPLDPNFQLAPLDPNFQLLAQPSGLDCVGWLDLGKLGVADRHADLAPALLSLGWNFGGLGFDETLAGYVHKELDDIFLEGYGLEVDEVRLDYYTRLWNAG